MFFKFKNDIEKLNEIDVKKIGDFHVNIETLGLKDFPETIVHIENLFDTTIDVVDRYYICNGCGHMYW